MKPPPLPSHYIAPPTVALPPPLPGLAAKTKDIHFCANVCFAVGVLGTIAIVGLIFRYLEGSAELEPVLFAIFLALLGFATAVELKKLGKRAEAGAYICLIITLFMFPLGTIFGAIALSKLNSAKSILTKRK